ncbi:MAG: GNAT family N-acetyltransferase [Roseiflexaceae bacterium]|nr:GNAT family N-acetyltransferase [Roseiflexaceae bacterium]
MSQIETRHSFRSEIVPGERIFLSHPLREDLPLLARWYADLELTLYLGRAGHAYTPEDEEQWFNNRNRDGVRSFAIIVRETNAIIGSVSLMKLDAQNGRAELGISIGEKTAWGKGYGGEAVRLMCAYGFTFLNLHMIYLWHVGYNERGHRAYLRAGFKEAGRLREARVFDGQRYDDVLMDITRADFGPTGLARMIGQINREEREEREGRTD